MGVKPISSSILAPKPVHPTAVRTHGLFGLPFVRQHMMFDDRWTPNSLTEQFKGMADLLAKRQIFKKLEFNANRKRYIRDNQVLRRQCRDGRTKLQMALYGENTNQIRNFLINHKDMQRLYQKMPVHMVVDNINQRTFVMRKERDRLRHRLSQLKVIYKNKLLDRAQIENRIKYENEFVLEEEVKSREFRKKIENSNVRLRAIKTVHGTYKRMIQILRHDAIFYEPILRSLNRDIDDQTNFIKHILYLGTPAIVKFKELSEEYRQMEEKARKSLQTKLQFVANYKKESAKRPSLLPPKSAAKTDDVQQTLKRYVRETDSMLLLKNELEAIEDTIKMVKFATLCSQAKEIFPRMKSNFENNIKLKKAIEKNMLGHAALDTKMKRAEVLEGVLVNNLADDEIERLSYIKELEQALATEDQIEAETVEYMKNRADSYVLLRFTLWNLNEILRHVDRPQKASRVNYPNSYLKLPLLKFEMLTMRACAPEIYEENLEAVMHSVKRKLYKLMKAFKPDTAPADIVRCVNDYHAIFLESMETDDLSEDKQVVQDEEEDVLAESKILQNVPNRKQIKADSAKIVDELSKKDD